LQREWGSLAQAGAETSATALVPKYRATGAAAVPAIPASKSRRLIRRPPNITPWTVKNCHVRTVSVCI